VSECTLTADEAAAIALERFGEGWVAQDGPERNEPCAGNSVWCWFRHEPYIREDRWESLGKWELIGPGHPNPDHWRETKRRIDHPPKGTTCSDAK
jgi:hypothetical protein